MEPGQGTPPSEELLVHGRFLRSLARALVPDAQRAEDLVQDTWVAALEHPPRHDGALRAWLAQILRRLALTKGQREGERGARERAADLERALAIEPEPSALTAEIELSRRVLECVVRLRDPYQSTLYLRYYRGLTPQHIAAEQRVPVKTVKTRLARGLELLRASLDRQHAGRREVWVALLLPLARAPLAPAPVSASPAPAAPLLAGAMAVLAVLGGGAYWLTRGPSARAEAPPSRAPVVQVPAPAGVVEEARVGDGRRALAIDPTTPPPEPTSLRVRGRVCGALGEPLPAAEVAVERFDLERRGFSARARLADGREGTPAELVRGACDAQGEFELELSGSGLARLTLEHEGYAARSRKLFVFLGQDLDLGTIALEPGVFLAGRVRDERGAPVPGAEILAARLDEGLTFGPGEPRIETIARTDEQGRFALTRVAFGPWRLEVHAPELAPAAAHGSTESAGERVEDIEVTLLPGAEIAGRVLGLASDELARARVLAVALERGPLAPAALSATPDARGAFRFGGLAAEAELELVLLLDADEHARRAGETRRVRAGDTDVELDVERRDGPRDSDAGARSRSRRETPAASGALAGSAEVLVRAPDGTPQAGALVVRREQRDERREPREIRATDREGRVRWDELGEGQHEFRVLSGVFGLEERAEDEAWSALEVRAGETRALELAAQPRASIHGVARSSGAPLAHARVLVRPAEAAGEGRGAMLTTTSDADGRFELRDLPLGSYSLELVHPARALPEEVALELGARGAELTLELAEARLRGLVRDESGRALGGVAVSVLADADAWSEPEWRAPARAAARSDAHGRFEIAGLDPARAPRLELAADGFATLLSAPLAPDSAQEFVLAPEAVLAVTFTGAAQPFALLVARGPRAEERALGLPAGRRTELRGLGAGSWRLTLESRSRRGPREARVLGERTLELEAGRTNELVWTLP